MKRISIFIRVIKGSCILGNSQKLMKTWSKGGRLVIIGFFLKKIALQQERAS
jgi:hypothetical protein